MLFYIFAKIIDRYHLWHFHRYLLLLTTKIWKHLIVLLVTLIGKLELSKDKNLKNTDSKNVLESNKKIQKTSSKTPEIDSFSKVTVF